MDGLEGHRHPQSGVNKVLGLQKGPEAAGAVGKAASGSTLNRRRRFPAPGHARTWSHLPPQVCSVGGGENQRDRAGTAFDLLTKLFLVSACEDTGLCWPRAGEGTGVFTKLY